MTSLNQFIGDTIAEMQSNGVSVFLIHQKELKDDGIPCSGFFSEEGPELRVATAKPTIEWIEIYIHEYCHFTQWRDKSKAWTATIDGKNSDDAENIIFNWFSGKRYQKKTILNSVEICRDIEVECEKRVVKLIKKYNLPIDIKNYIRKANAYLYFWSIIPQIKCWSKKGPYEVPEIAEKMPSTFKKDYNVIPPQFIDMIKTYCL